MSRPSKAPRTEPPIEELAKAWLAIDYVSQTKTSIERCLEAGDTLTLEKLLRKRLAFGTAGLRGPMGAGCNRMNPIVVLQCTQGIVAFLEKNMEHEKLKAAGVVIGYDHRDDLNGIDSEMIARAAAAVCVHKGIKTYLFSTVVCTPMVPFCVKAKGCAAGMMVTASHNPKADNGYKMYGSNGAQLCEPNDTAIAELILDNLVPWTDYARASAEVRSSALCVDVLDEMKGAYFKEMVETLCFHPQHNREASLRITYTAMHGVGTPFTRTAFESFGHAPLVMVPEQNEPDATFPTVAYPNPEEGKGALELAFQAANAAGSPLVLANDPDADRLAVAERQPSGQWQMFSGNEIGMLLAHWLMTKARERGAAVEKLAVVASTVSSKMTRALAQHEGMHFDETLTGFKWICNRKAELQAEGYQVVLAFEESIGFCCGNLVNDKDGVCAAAVFAELAVDAYRRGSTVSRHLVALYETYGHFISRQGYVTVPDPSLTIAIFDEIRAGGKYPSAIGSYEVAHVRDLTTGYDGSTPDQKTVLPASTSSQHLTFTFRNGCVANLRGSGTEPKLKYYVELHGSDKDAVTATLLEMVKTIVLECLQPERNGLKWAGVE